MGPLEITLLAACAVLAGACAWFWTRGARAPAAAATPAVAPPALERLDDHAGRLVELELEVKRLRREQAEFIEDAEGILESVERKRRRTAGSASKLKREEELAQGAIPELREQPALPPAERAQVLRLVRARLMGRGL